MSREQNFKNSDLYVTLEPCTHYGVTPPCTNIIAKKGSIVFHHGDTWHGSGFNRTRQDRITLSIHFMNGNSKFHNRIKNPHFNHYKIFNSLKMDETFFPITWHKSKKTFFKDKYLKR